MTFSGKFIKTLACLSAVSLCAACSDKPKLELADYWQRSHATSALHLQGPKAQQMLHQDISRCTNEVRELKNLEEIRNATPGEPRDGDIDLPNSPEGQLSAWDTPERQGFLRTEHSDYHDFETCMMAAGWERVEYLPYNLAEDARDEYLRGKKKQMEKMERDRENVTSVHYRAQNDPPFDDLND